MELEIQKFLRAGGSFTQLSDKYGIISKRSSDYPELVLFKYSQIDSPMGEQIVQECRGIILNGDNNWSVVARPYNKFFNNNEGHAAEIDWTSAKVYDKLDGSLMTLYWYDGWRVSSSGNPDASGEVWNGLGNTITFKDLFWQTFKELNYQLPYTALETNLSFMFELMTPYNKVVVHHTKPRLVLHGVRNIKTGKETSIDCFGIYNWELCKTYDFSSIEEVVHNADQLEPIKYEGYVIADSNFNRIKVKSPAYVALHHLRDSLSARRMLEIVRSNEGSEFLTYFPEFEELYLDVRNKYDELVAYLVCQLCEIEVLLKSKGCLTRKDLGLHTKGKFYQGIMFRIIFDNKDLKECLSTMSIRKLESWIQEVNE